MTIFEKNTVPGLSLCTISEVRAKFLISGDQPPDENWLKNKEVMTLWRGANFHKTSLDQSIWICKWASWCHRPPSIFMAWNSPVQLGLMQCECIEIKSFQAFQIISLFLTDALIPLVMFLENLRNFKVSISFCPNWFTRFFFSFKLHISFLQICPDWVNCFDAEDNFFNLWKSCMYFFLGGVYEIGV